MANVLEIIGLKAVLEGVSGYLSNLDKMEKAEKGVGEEAEKAEKKTKDMGAAMTKMSMAGTAAFVGLGALAVKFAMGFENQMSQVGAILQANDEDMEKLSATAKQLGADTAFSANDAAKAMEELAAGGRSVAQIIGGEATAAVALAAAGNYDLANSARTIATTMDVWKDTQIDTNDVVNRLAGAANTSRFGVEDMSQAIASGGGVAAQAGVDFQDFSTVIAATASSFNSGSDAGTSFKTFITSLTGNSEKAKDMIKQLGLEFYTAQGQLKPMSEIVQELNTAMSGLSQEQQTVALKTIFGNDAFRTAAGLMKMTGDEFTAMSAKMGNTKASEVAKQRMDNLSGSLEQLKGSAETLAIATGERVIPALTLLAQGATMAVNAFTAMPASTQNMVLGFTAVVVALPAMISGLGKAKVAIETINTAMHTGKGKAVLWGAAISAAIIGLDVLSQKATGVSLTERIFGDVAGAQAATRAARDFDAVVKSMGPNVDKVAVAQEQLRLKTAGAAEAFAKLANENKDSNANGFFANLDYQIQSFTGLGDGAKHAAEEVARFKETTKLLGLEMMSNGASLYQLKQTYDSLPEPLKKVFDETTNVVGAWDEMARSAQEGGDRIEAMRRAGVIPLTTELADLAKKTEEAKTPLDKLRDSFGEAGMTADDFSKSLDELSGRFSDFNPEVIQAQGQLAAVDEELADLARSGGTWSESLGMTKDQLIAQKKALEDIIATSDENQKATKGMRDELLLYLNQGLYNLDSKLASSNLMLEDQITVQQGVAKALRALSNDDIPGFITALESIETKMPGVSATVVSNLGPDLSLKLKGNIPELHATGSALGDAIATGLEQGLNSAANRIVATGRGLIDNLMGEMAREAKVESPSKVTMYQGKMIAEGLIVGIENATPEVKKAGTKLVGEIQENMDDRIVEWINSLGDDVRSNLKQVFETIPWDDYGLTLYEDMSVGLWHPAYNAIEEGSLLAASFAYEGAHDIVVQMQQALDDGTELTTEQLGTLLQSMSNVIMGASLPDDARKVAEDTITAWAIAIGAGEGLANQAVIDLFDSIKKQIAAGQKTLDDLYANVPDYVKKLSPAAGGNKSAGGTYNPTTPWYIGGGQTAPGPNDPSAVPIGSYYPGIGYKTANGWEQTQGAAASLEAAWQSGAYQNAASMGKGLSPTSGYTAPAGNGAPDGTATNQVTINMQGAQLTGTMAENEAMIYKVVNSALQNVSGRDAFMSGVNA